MSTALISLNPDLLRLRNEGYEVEIREGYLVIHAIPYVNNRAGIARGSLVSTLTMSGDRTQRPDTHVVWFSGEQPCDQHGQVLAAINHSVERKVLCPGLEVQRQFSCKPKDGYADYYAKMIRYIQIISHSAQAIDPNVTACTFQPIAEQEITSVFCYMDTASSRAGIASLNKKLATQKVAIIGLGGTGAYILDQLAKTPVAEIHLYDGDYFYQHNAFRSPGAASIAQLQARPLKIEYLAQLYSHMHRGIHSHAIFIDDTNIDVLAEFSFVFVCVDKSLARKLISDYLVGQGVPFIDVGLNVEYLNELDCLRGACRVTLSTPQKHDHLDKYLPMANPTQDPVYASPIQIADMNALNAQLAIIRWKKFCGFYLNLYDEHQCVFVLDTQQLTRDESKG